MTTVNKNNNLSSHGKNTTEIFIEESIFLNSEHTGIFAHYNLEKPKIGCKTSKGYMLHIV